MATEENEQNKTAGETTTAQEGAGEAEVWRERTYTGTLIFIALVYISFFTHYDLTRGNRYLALAFGMESDFWLTVSRIVGLFLSFYFSFEIALRIYLYEIVKIYREKPLSPFAFGLYDICFWSSLLLNAVTFYLFVRFVPAGALGSLRPFALFLAPIIPTCILVVIITRRTLRALYGTPPPSSRSVNS